jgi:hypothetical protein
VLPNSIAASCQLFGKFHFASGFEPLDLIRRKTLIPEQQVVAAVALHHVPIGQHAPDHIFCDLGVVLYLAAIFIEQRTSDVRDRGPTVSAQKFA